jgi:ATP-dependent DNA helicase PIF1
MLAAMTTPRVLEIKTNAKVMATVNDRDKAYYNGSIGYVADWSEETIDVHFLDSNDIVPVRRFTFTDEHRNGTTRKNCNSVQQFPLKLAWAITIHSGQGQTLTKCFVEASHVFCAHQTYVALSRCRTLEGLSIRGFEPGRCYVDADAKRFYEELKAEPVSP